jgi:hypothetical protein
MDINCNKVTYEITNSKPLISHINSIKDAHKTTFTLHPPKASRTNFEHTNTINQHASNKQRADKLQLYHQNIRGLHIKIEELATQWTNHFPHLLCFTEHHLKKTEINNIHIKNYSLGASYCRHSRKHGRVGIFVHHTLSYFTINLNKLCNDYDFEACAVKLLISTNIYL